jgi:hypothetical protein
MQVVIIATKPFTMRGHVVAVGELVSVTPAQAATLVSRHVATYEDDDRDPHQYRRRDLRAEP